MAMLESVLAMLPPEPDYSDDDLDLAFLDAAQVVKP
jgi:hypothetical protein